MKTLNSLEVIQRRANDLERAKELKISLEAKANRTDEDNQKLASVNKYIARKEAK